jgi:hypothetical protein
MAKPVLPLTQDGSLKFSDSYISAKSASGYQSIFSSLDGLRIRPQSQVAFKYHSIFFNANS